MLSQNSVRQDDSIYIKLWNEQKQTYYRKITVIRLQEYVRNPLYLIREKSENLFWSVVLSPRCLCLCLSIIYIMLMTISCFVLVDKWPSHAILSSKLPHCLYALSTQIKRTTFCDFQFHLYVFGAQYKYPKKILYIAICSRRNINSENPRTQHENQQHTYTYICFGLQTGTQQKSWRKTFSST